jgi:hypothetical protein
MSANETQIGGSHYQKGGEQHWDRIYRLFGPGYLIGSATKYIERYKEKNGRQDLEKAAHFIQKLIELEYPNEANCSYCGAGNPEETNCPYQDPKSTELFRNSQKDVGSTHLDILCPDCKYPHGRHTSWCARAHPGYVNQDL